MDYGHVLETAIAAALDAGALLRHELHGPGGPRGAHDKAPADTEAEVLIRARLLGAFPTFGYLGEETGAQAGTDPDRHVWLVDPNDGTTAFVEGERGTAVSIGLLREGVPVLGVVFAFAAPDDAGDLVAGAEGCGPVRRNGVPLPAREWATTLAPHAVVLVSSSAHRKPAENARAVRPSRHLAMPSIAYRLALAAAGDGDAAVSLNAPGAWDYAAGHALVLLAGGVFVDERAQPVTYAMGGESRTRRCFAGSVPVVEELAGRDWAAVLTAPAVRPERLDLVRPRPGTLTADPSQLPRAQGCLLGQLAGDSLGSLVEFEHADELRSRFPSGVRDLADGGCWDTLAGQPTDDSEMALALARTIVLEGRFDDEAVAAAYRAWLDSGPFDAGTTVSAALDGIADEDVAGRCAGQRARTASPRGSASNGSLMRVSPLGIWASALSAEDAAARAREDASLTHANVTSQEATAAFVVALGEAIRGADRSSVYERTIAWATAAGRDASVVETLRSAAREPPRDFAHQQGWVLIALQNAFFRLLHARSLEEGVIETVMAGGDTDTNAAIAGALLGAVHGRDAVPSRWRRLVLTCRPLQGLPGVVRPRPRTYWPVDALNLAERLLWLAPR